MCRYLGSTPWDNRLVAARIPNGGAPSGSAGDPDGDSTVYFSNTGDPETWDNDGAGGTPHLHLGPGDGDTINAVVTWRDYVLVFKQYRFWVFYGTSALADGTPQFDYRPVDTGQGCFPGGAVACPDGVYFINREGVWRTSGGHPEKISSELDPWWRDESLFYWNDIDPDLTVLHNSRISYASGKLFVHARGSSGYVTFVYEMAEKKWSVWGRHLSVIGNTCELEMSGEQRTMVGVFGQNEVFYLDRDAVEDDTSATQTTRDIESAYRTGFYDLDVQQEKRLYGFDVWGTGDVTVKASADFGALDAGTAVTLGTSPAVARKRVPSKTKDGTVFSHQFGASSGRWQVHRCALEVDGARVEGTVS